MWEYTDKVTEKEIDFVVDKLPGIIENLRGISPYWKAEADACEKS